MKERNQFSYLYINYINKAIVNKSNKKTNEKGGFKIKLRVLPDLEMTNYEVLEDEFLYLYFMM